ncbi:MAG: hypothetical protein RLZZ297_214 [Chloroflexota bacterium]|jgi:ribosomal protein S18 acetylase RimI-like enzyme
MTHSYRSLVDTPLTVIHAAFVAAFSDYSQPMHLTVADLATMFETRSGSLADSHGAFVDGALVGFVLVGLRDIDGVRTGYDVATAVVPEHRGRGVATALLRHTLAALAGSGVRRFVLEVIDTNDAAIRLYTRLGFEVQRALACYRWSKPASDSVAAVSAPVHLDAVDERAWNGYRPSWQNALPSYRVVAATQRVVGFTVGGELRGYGIVNPSTGSIMQLGLHPEHQTDAALRALIDQVAAQTDAAGLRIVNVEAECRLATALADAGWECFVRQFEMVLELRVVPVGGMFAGRRGSAPS